MSLYIRAVRMVSGLASSNAFSKSRKAATAEHLSMRLKRAMPLSEVPTPLVNPKMC